MGIFSRQQIDDIFFYCSKKIEFYIPCRLSPKDLNIVQIVSWGDIFHEMSIFIFKEK